MLLRFFFLLILTIQIPYVFGSAQLDVVFLIDQSGSMWGSKQHPKANDKYKHRISIVENVIVRLAEHAKGTPLIHRVSVVEFGGDNSVSVAVPISVLELKYNPAKPNDIVSKTKRYVTNILHSRTRNMGNTNTPLAMKTTLAEFHKLKAKSGGEIRERMLLFITDGRPYTYKKQLERLRSDIENHAEELKGSSISLWVIGLNDASDYWNTGDGAFWEEVAGLKQTRFAETSFPNIASIVQDVVDQWLGMKSIPLLSDEYHSRPYLKRIVFNVHFSKPGAKPEFLNPNGQSIPVAENPAKEGTYVRYVVDNPMVGTYQLKRSSNGGYKIFVEENVPSLTFIGPHGAINQNVEDRIVFKVMQDAQGLQEIPQWPVTAKMIVTAPSGHQQDLAATFEGDGKYVAPWTPTAVGIHQFAFKAEVNVKTNKGPKQYDLVTENVTGNVEVLAYTVPNNAIWLHLASPDPQEGLTVLPWITKTATVKMSLHEGDHQVMKLADVVSEPETWLKIEVMDESGIALSEPIALKPEEAYFIGQIPIEVNSWLYPDKIHLRVVAEPRRLSEDRTLHGIWLPEEVEDKRLYGGNTMTVADIDLHLSIWVLLLLGVILIPLLIGLLWIIVNRLLPCLSVRGEDAGRTVNLLIYDGLDDPSGYSAKKFPITGQCHSKLDRQIHVQTDEGKSLVAEYFRLSREPNSNAPMVTIRYRWQGEEKHREHLLMLSARTPKNLEGLPAGNYMIALGY